MRSFAATGQLVPSEAGWVFEPSRHLPGASPSPRVLLGTLRTARATAGRYLERRRLARPDVPWTAYRELYG